MPWGYVGFIALLTLGMLSAVVPLARSGPGAVLTWLASALVNESPSLGAACLLFNTAWALLVDRTPASDVAPWFLVGCASFAATPIVLLRASRARVALEQALDVGLGTGWQQLAATRHTLWRRRPPWHRIVALPLPILTRGLHRRRGLRYGLHRRHRLDVYGATNPESRRPVLVHLHGGAFRSGRKSFYARPLLHAFARHGWVCVSASYRLRPATYPQILSDVKRIIAWTRDHVTDFGGDPDTIVLAGSSAGAHLAITASLTANHADLQPGFEDADTSVRLGIGLYGYYGPADQSGPPSQPSAYAHAEAPPIMIVHGTHDTLAPSERARHLANTLRSKSRRPVVYAELPGAQHSFDLLHSRRFELVIDALWCFAAWATFTPASIA